MTKNNILIITPFFSPNIGGVETHLDDLVDALDDLNYKVYVQTYSTIVTPNTPWLPYEKRGKNIEITRYGWLGKGIFHKIEKYTFLDFLYITPYLLFRILSWAITHRNEIDIIHAQGFNAAYIGLILKVLYKKKLIVSTHAIYELPSKSLTVQFAKYILNRADKVLCLSKGSMNELVKFGVRASKMDLYKYWIDLAAFSPKDKKSVRATLGFDEKFTALFVGRLIKKKGADILIQVAKILPEVNFVFIGAGPEERNLRELAKDAPNIKILGSIPNKKLGDYYSCADIFCIASQYEEGFGRVVMEAVAAGLPVVGSNMGAIPEALDPTVSVLFEPTVSEFAKAITKLYSDKNSYVKLASNCRDYAEKHFSRKNVDMITNYYD